jgi:SAM-dependent methyltransferase
MKLLSNTTHLTHELRTFFADHAATLLGIQESKRDNFERFPAPGDGLLQCFTAHVLFHNVGIFGQEGDYLREVHPRMTTLTMELANRLNEGGYEVSGPLAQTIVAILPYADPLGVSGKSLAPSMRPSKGQHIIPAEELIEKSAYYASFTHKYGASFGVVTNNGTVVGPDAGIVGAACGIAATFNRKIRVVELGSGGGSTALVLAKRNTLESYRGNDFSSEMVDHFRANVAPQLERRGIESTVFLGSCFDMPPVEAPVDLISIGVYYQAQPSLIEKRGQEFARSLGESGVLIIQTGMLEDPFITHILSSSQQSASAWPWYRQSYHLNNYFRYVAEYVIEQEIVLVATNSRDRFLHIATSLNTYGDLRKLSAQRISSQ